MFNYIRIKDDWEFLYLMKRAVLYYAINTYISMILSYDTYDMHKGEETKDPGTDG